MPSPAIFIWVETPGFTLERSAAVGTGLVAFHLSNEEAGTLKAPRVTWGATKVLFSASGGRIGVLCGMAEFRGVDVLVDPLFFIGVGLFGLRAAAEFLVGLGGFFFLPLIHLDLAGQAEGRGGEGECRIADDIAGGDLATDMHEFLLVRRSDGCGLDGDDSLVAFFEAFGSGDAAAFVPEEQEDRDGDEEDAEETLALMDSRFFQGELACDFSE